ncbi:ABC transporter ATP-binding protein [Pseudophaeobacter sp.]|uniref:ABC transporter ATP-binding protein n=1 Tax=Pseudophaeobacter sp. TaxID=1971739 RepID=UPI0032996112
MVLKITELTKNYPGTTCGKPLLNKISLQLAPASSLALTGESGSGKSTLLHLIAALDNFDSGEIYVDGQALSKLDETGAAALRRSTVSLVFQSFNIIPSLTVSENISLHAKLAKRRDTTWEDHLTQRLGLTELGHRYPEQLSGGQQQRVAIARAMALKPKLLLADEPTGNLDEDSSNAVLELMLDLIRDCETSLFLVTHSRAIAAKLQNHLHLSGGKLS